MLTAVGRSNSLSGFSYTKADRLLKRKEFLELSRNGKIVQNRFFIIRYATGRHDRSRLGITITKKTAIAAKRNRMKRILREYFRTQRARSDRFWDTNIIVKKDAVDRKSAEIFASLDELYKKINGTPPR